MHMKTCKLVICDIDGTIVVKHKKLTSRAKKVINLLQQNGIYFGIASGRPIFQIKETIKGWGYDDFDVLIGNKRQYDPLSRSRIKIRFRWNCQRVYSSKMQRDFE